MTKATEPTLDSQTAPPTPRRVAGLAESYKPGILASDEMLEADGALRPHWRPFVSMMDDLGQEEVMSRLDQARRIIRENGIAHNVYEDSEGYSETEGLARPWSLDLLPLLVPDSQWISLGEALVQRARLLNTLLVDIYGPATCLSSGVLPPELIFSNPWFLRPLKGVTPRHDQWLHLYAADVVRASDGQFRVLSDRSQAPLGLGFSLENRIVLSRVLPTVFRQCNVLRLAPFFIAMRKMLLSLAPANRENPRVVLLTPGPNNETYFEHAYLARYLGYTLVQGNDLTVRDGRVYLKTLGGLQRVDVILRRVDDDFCDPLELFARSFQGVPGLLQAVRDGTVSVANALGSGTLQSAAFLPYLPALNRHFFGEDLKIASVPTWWCGDPNSLRYVLSNLERLVIKPAFSRKTIEPIYGETLTANELKEWSARIKAKPADFVAQEQMTSFSAPILVKDSVQPRRLVIRAFLTASNGGYHVMPGGLTRVSGSSDSLMVSAQHMGGSKDTWILAQSPVSEVSLLVPATQPVELSRGGGDLTSRMADDLFWLGRYTQRAETVIRLARSVFNRLSDPNFVEGHQTIKLLLHELIGWIPALEPGYARDVASELFSHEDPSGLRSLLMHVHNLARVLRDRISADAWQILRQIDREFSNVDSDIDDERIAVVLEVLNKLISGFLAFGGMAADSMTRGQAWRFLDMGMRVERALSLSRLIGATLVQVSDQEMSLLDALLDIGDSSLTYRRRYFTRVEVPAVLDLLIADETNPRSIAFQITALEQHLADLPRESTHPQRWPDRQMAFKLRGVLRLVDLTAACKATKGQRDRLKVLLNDIAQSLTSISETVSQVYFSHASSSARLLSDNPE